jgi:hypothetical protein
MKNSLKDKLILIVIFVVAIYMFFASCYGTYKLFAQDTGEIIFIDEVTGTEYVQKSKYIEVKGTDGYTEYIGNGAELEF